MIFIAIGTLSKYSEYANVHEIAHKAIATLNRNLMANISNFCCSILNSQKSNHPRTYEAVLFKCQCAEFTTLEK